MAVLRSRVSSARVSLNYRTMDQAGPNGRSRIVLQQQTDVVGVAVDLAGNADCVATTSAELLLEVQLASAVSCTGVASATVKLEEQLAGTATGVVTTSAALDVVVPGVDLAGSSTGTVATSATLQNVVQLAANSSCSLSSSGSLLKTIEFAGNSSGVCSSAGELAQSTPLAGSSTGVVNASGDLNTSAATDVSLSATAVCTIAATGSLSAEPDYFWDTTQGMAGKNRVEKQASNDAHFEHDNQDITDIIQMVANLWP